MSGVRPVAIDLDGALGDTRPLWSAWLASAAPLLGVDPDALPADRGEAAAELDRRGAGNWRTLLERFSEERAPIYLRRDAGAAAALRPIAVDDRTIGVYTDAPEPLAQMMKKGMGWNFAPAALGAKITREIVDLVLAGRVKPVIGRVIEFDELPAAIDAMANRRTIGRTIAKLY